jgi:TRAP-type C4-dicarboxylate transport system permease small subunit
MSGLTQGLVGWLTIMAMVFGGVGVLFFIMSAIRAVVVAAREVKQTTTEAASQKVSTLATQEVEGR